MANNDGGQVFEPISSIPAPEISEVVGQDALNERSVRICSDECAFIKHAGRGNPKGCSFYIKKEVKFGQPCLHDIKIIEGFVASYKSGGTEYVKETVGAIVGSMIVQIHHMIAQLSRDGLTSEEPILDGKGNPIYFADGRMAVRIIEHPLINKIVSLSKSIGFDLSKFNLTPSTSGEKSKTQGNILLSTGSGDINLIIQENRDRIKKFEESAKIADADLENDPVYKEMSGKNASK